MSVSLARSCCLVSLLQQVVLAVLPQVPAVMLKRLQATRCDLCDNMPHDVCLCLQQCRLYCSTLLYLLLAGRKHFHVNNLARDGVVQLLQAHVAFTGAAGLLV